VLKCEKLLVLLYLVTNLSFVRDLYQLSWLTGSVKHHSY